MNARNISTLDRCVEAGLLLLVFLLPLACYFKTYDPGMLKDLTLMGAGALVACLALFRQFEAGRFELPASRTWMALLAGALLLWISASFGMNPNKEASLFPAGRLWLFAALFLVVLLGPASVSFARRLSSWTLAAAGLAGILAVLQALGLDAHPWSRVYEGRSLGTFRDPALLGAFLGAAFPLALAAAADRERSGGGRGLAGLAGALCAAGVMLSGSQAGLLAFGTAALAFAVPVLLYSKGSGARASGLAALGAVPALLTASQLGNSGLGSRILDEWAVWSDLSRGAWRMFAEHLWTGVGAGGFAVSFSGYPSPASIDTAGHIPVWSAKNAPLQLAAELGLPGLLLISLLLGAVLWLAAKDIELRHNEGETGAALLQSGQMAALLGLLAAGTISGALDSAYPGLLLWLLAGSMTGLSLERGAATVRVLPIPAPAGVRRLAAVPLCALLLFAGVWQVRFFGSDLRLNSGVRFAASGLEDAAHQDLGAVSAWHPLASLARCRSGDLLRRSGGRRALRAALRSYQEAERLFPHYLQVDLKKAVAYQALGEWDMAEKSLLAYAAVDAFHAETYRRLSEVSLILGKPEQARRSAIQLVRIAPEDPESWRFLADHYHGSRDFRTARLMFQKAERISELAKAKSRPKSVH